MLLIADIGLYVQLRLGRFGVGPCGGSWAGLFFPVDCAFRAGKGVVLGPLSRWQIIRVVTFRTDICAYVYTITFQQKMEDPAYVLIVAIDSVSVIFCFVFMQYATCVEIAVLLQF